MPINDVACDRIKQMMEHTKKISSRLFNSTVLEPKDDLDEKLERCYATVNGFISGLSERETNDVLQAYVCKGQTQHEEVQLSLLYGLLIDPKVATRSYRDMTLMTRDGLMLVLTRTNQLIHEKWIKLADEPRLQLLWFSKELVKNNVIGADSVCHSLIRQIAGGDVSSKNIFLTDTLLDMLIEYRPWLEKHQPLLASAVYTYLRVIVDHTSPAYSTLRQKEVEFVVMMIRERWADCMPLGRDLVRLLQYVARIPEIEKLWKDILHNPTALSPTFTGVQQLMGIRTSRRHFVSRLTPDMEAKLGFLTSKVRFGQQKRYQDWFQRQYLSTPESQSLRCDLIRYICAVIHPSNELLCSDIIPRWAVIGWLLTTCTSNVAASNAKLSLFYDWLFFEPDKDSIMNIEPCILVMHHSMRPHPAITATLLDFMCRIMPNFYPPLSHIVKTSMYTALKTILQKRVLQSLSPLFDNPKLDRELRTMIRENFGEFCSVDMKEEVQTPPMSKNQMVIDTANNHHLGDSGMADMGEFSEEEDEPPSTPGEPALLSPAPGRPSLPVMPVKVANMELQFEPISEPVQENTVDIADSLEQLDEAIKMAVIDFQSETDNEIQCNMMDRVIDTMIQNTDFDQDQATVLAHCLTQLFMVHFSTNIYPPDPDDESIEDSIGTPLFVIFRNLCQTLEEDPSRQPILLLLEEMYNKTPRIGYLFLYFLKVSMRDLFANGKRKHNLEFLRTAGLYHFFKVHDDKMSAYKDFCNSMESKDIASCLLTDLQLCQEDDVRLFTFLIPDIYTQFPNIAIGNSNLLLLIVSSIDGSQLQDLICQILQGHLIMFRKDSFLAVLNASLEWETIEQYFLWQLIAAHNIPVEHLMPILPKLEFTVHSEALSSILVLLKQDGPSVDIMRPILCRQCKKVDLFTVSILKFWAQEYEDKLAEILHSLLIKTSTTPNRKRKQSIKSDKDKDKGPSMDQTLAHLEHMRSTCKNVTFLMNESLQQALQHVQTTCSETMKTKFSELLALAEDFEDVRTTRVLRAVPSRRAMASQITQNKNMMQQSSNKQKKHIVEDSDSSDDSSECEEIVKQPRAKKRKKTTGVITVEDDSD